MRFRVGEWTVHPDEDRLVAHGETRTLRPQVMNILAFLAARPGKTVSNQQLMDELWPGKIVTPGTLYNAVNELRQALGDDAHNARFIETIPKRGYRLIAEVQRLEPPDLPDDPLQSPAVTDFAPDARSDRRLNWASATVLLALIALLGWILLGPLPERLQPGRGPGIGMPQRSIAVLPFDDMSEEGDQTYLAHGLSEEIINRLAQLPGLKVSGRTSSFALQESQAGFDQIGALLGVAHLLEGSVRKEGNRLRITAQLIDAKDGFHLWSKTYEREMSELFAVQDDIAAEIVGALETSLGVGGGDLVAALPAAFRPDLRAYDHYLRARNYAREASKKSLMMAREELERALEIDPDFARAHVELALTLIELRWYADYFRSPTERESASESAWRHIERALELEPELASAHTALARYWFDNEAPDSTGGNSIRHAEVALHRAIELNPQDSRAHYLMTWVNGNRLASVAAGIEHLERAVEIDPLWSEPAIELAGSLQALPHRAHEAEAIFTRLLEMYPENPKLLWKHAVWLTGQGRLAEAVKAAEKSMLEDPDFVPARWTIAAAWYSLGEPGWAAQNGTLMHHWKTVLEDDREASLGLLQKIDDKLAAGEIPPEAAGFLAYSFLMLDRPRDALRVLGYGEDQEEPQIPGPDFALATIYSPAMVMATAFRMLGRKGPADHCLEQELRAADVRFEHGKYKNAEYWRIMARVHALRGEEYAALLALERLTDNGPLDPRELMHPAYDGIRHLDQFADLVDKRAALINAEREKLGLEATDLVAYQSPD